MTSSHLTVDSIIRKYQQRQQQLSHSLTLDQLNAVDTSRDKQLFEKGCRSGVQTPAFSDFTNRKESKTINEYIERTHKKNQSNQPFTSQQINSFPFKFQSSSKQDYQKILIKLDQTEDKLVRSQKNYAQIWRKYELLLKEGKKSQKSIQIEQQLRGKQNLQLNDRIQALQKQNKNLKQCMNAKENNLLVLREKLQQKNQRYIESQRTIDSLKSEIENLRQKQLKIEEEKDLKKRQREQLVEKLREELARFETLMTSKENEKKDLISELENSYISHKEELQMLKASYSKVEEEYKEWVEECKKQKLGIIEEYESKLKKYQKQKLNSSQNFIDSLKQQILNKNQQIQQTMTQNMKLNSEMKKIKEELEVAETIKKELIVKVSTLENSVIQKLDQQRSQQQSVNRLQNMKRGEEEKLREITQKYNKTNSELQELKSKYSEIVQQIEERKRCRRNEAQQIIRLKKELETVRQQMEKSRNNQMTLSNRLTEAVTSLKKKSHKFDQEKHQLMTEFMAQKLQTARLRQQLQETKVHLKRQYQLSLQNTKKELEQQIKVNLQQPSIPCDLEKEQLYMQLRQLQRRYQLLTSEIVSVEDVMGIAAKVHRRYQSKQ